MNWFWEKHHLIKTSRVEFLLKTRKGASPQPVVLMALMWDAKAW